MARENRNIILRFCWLVGWVGLGWKERWRLRFFGEDCQEILMSKPYNYRLASLARPLTPPSLCGSSTYNNLYSVLLTPIVPPHLLKYF